jgi:hypothetical protein
MSKCKNLFLLFTLFLFTGLSFNSYAGPVTLPNYIGETEAFAIADLNATDGLNYDAAGSTKVNNAAPLDQVIDQNPAAGLVDFGTDVTLVVSLGPATTTTSTTGATTSTTGATTSTTGATTSTTGATTSTTGASTSTTGGGTTTTTTAASTSTTAPTTSTTTSAATTTTTLPPNQSDYDNFDFGGGGCTLSKTPTTGMDPIWLFLLLAPGLGILRRRVAATGARRTKSI